MNFIIVNKLFWNDDNKYYSEGEDYSFLNPRHVISIESLRREVLKYDEELGHKRPMNMFVYRITLMEDGYLLCTVEDRGILYSQVTGLNYLDQPI